MILKSRESAVKTYICFGISTACIILYLSTFQHSFFISGEVHTVLESVTTFFALFTGIIALIRYYSHKRQSVLFIAVGFLSAGYLDGLHSLFTNAHLPFHSASSMADLCAWTWFSSRMALSTSLLSSWFLWDREHRFGPLANINTHVIYITTSLVLIVLTIAFIFVPLPRGLFPELWFSRPFEFLPGLLFLLALIGYLSIPRKDISTTDYWIIGSICVNFWMQSLFVVSSRQLFDSMFAVAHFLEIIAYGVMLTGFMISAFNAFLESERAQVKIQRAFNTVKNAKTDLERALAESRHNQDLLQRSHDLLNQSTDLFFVLDPWDSRILDSNHTAEVVLGYTRSELLKKKIMDIDTQITNVTVWRDTVHQIKSESALTLVSTIECKDGSQFPAEISARYIVHHHKDYIIASIRDITERLHLENLKTEFISTATHELRTPITIIQGVVENLLDGVNGPLEDAVRNDLDIADRNLDRLRYIVNNLLDISRLESGRTDPDYTTASLPDFLRHIIDEHRPFADEKHLAFDTKYPNYTTPIQLDKNMIQQVLCNLLSNSLRYAKTQIVVGYRPISTDGDDFVEFFIGNDGPFIPKADCKRVFEKFVQLDRPIGGMGYKGTGLGLAISAEIVRLHHGTIWVESSRGELTTFHFVIPVSQSGNSNQAPSG